MKLSLALAFSINALCATAQQKVQTIVVKPRDALETVKQSFPELKNAKKSIAHTTYGRFGILLQTPDSQTQAYLVGDDKNHNLTLEEHEVTAVFVSMPDSNHTNMIVLSNQLANGYSISVAYHTNGRFPVKKYAADTTGPAPLTLLNNGSPNIKKFSDAVSNMKPQGTKMLATQDSLHRNYP